MTTRRGWREDAIYFDHDAPCRDSQRHRHCQGRWRGSVSLGFGPDGKRIRPRVSGKTKTIVQDKLKKLHEELETGLRTDQGYTVRRAAEDWLAEGLSGRAAKTIKKNENVLAPILAAIGARKLRELTAGDVHQALTAMAQRYSSAAVAMGHNALTRAIRHAEARDLVGRNVATLVETPKGQAGRPSNSLTLEQASALLAAAEGTRMHAYISLCLATGIRTEEARALRWEHVDFGDPVASPPVPASAAVWRSVRSHGDTKTEKSRRTLALPEMAVTALWAHRERQAAERLAAGGQWSERDLVFATRTGGALDAANVRREFKAACRAAHLGEHWTPRELRHSFVSLMSSSGVPVEEIARLAGHSNTRTTEVVYRRELRPVLTTGAEAMDRLFQKIVSPSR
ncbi:MAG TPA: site-specific integrase [Streptosporangiaceae bacterium]|nr:site-specific integrase [Streptosporangiaceae bacterium]